MDLNEIVFFHGWGFNGSSWNAWHNTQSVGTFDRGYFYNDKKSNVGAFPKTIVAHSLGLHFVPTELFSHCEKLIVIGGFRNFHEHSIQDRRSKLINKAMQRKLKTEPQEVLHNFYKACALDERLYPETINLNIPLLMEDLDYLDTAQIDPGLLKRVASIELLHGAKDEIVSLAHAESLHKQLPNATLRVHPDAGHALPFNHSDWCMQSISNRILAIPISGSSTA
jgi:hypothetical protein